MFGVLGFRAYRGWGVRVQRVIAWFRFQIWVAFKARLLSVACNTEGLSVSTGSTSPLLDEVPEDGRLLIA